MASKAIGFLNFKFGADLSGFERALNKAQKKLKKFGKNIKKTGQNMSRNITLPILALGAASIKTFADFEQSMLKVKAVSGATGEEFKMLTELAKKLGSTTMFTASQVADLQIELSKLGFSATQIEDASESILNLAQATDTELGEAAKTTAVALNSFNLEAKESTRITDIMALAASSSAMDMEKFGSVLPKVGATARIAGDSFEDMSAKIQVLADSGMEGSKIGTQLKIIYSKLAKSGLTWDEAMGKIQNSTTKISTASKLFGENAFNAAIILSENTIKLDKYSEANMGAAGTSKKLADIMDSGIGGAMRRLQSQTEGLLIQLGTALMPVFTKVLDKLSDLVTWFSTLSDETKKNIVIWGLVLAAIGPILIIFGTLSIALGALMSPIGLAALAVGSLTTAFIYLKTSSSEVATSVRNNFTGMSNGILSSVNTAIAALNMLGANMDLYELDSLEEGGVKKGKRFSSKKLSDLKITDIIPTPTGGGTDEVVEDLKKDIEELEEPLSKVEDQFKGIVTWKNDFFKAGKSDVEDQFKDILFWTQELTEAQKAHNASIVLMKDIMFSAAMSAANSQEDFFKGFIENIKKAIKQLLIQLAIMTVINIILGGPTMTLAKAFTGAKASVLGLAEGGLVTGPTTALIGEGVGTTASNPEVVAPLDKLKSMMGGGNQNIIVEGVLKGNDIYLSNRNTSINRLRTT